MHFITGADALAQILSWKDAEEALAMARFVGVTRPGYELSDAQLPIDQKRNRATWVIENGDNLADTERQVAAWWDEVVGNSG